MARLPITANPTLDRSEGYRGRRGSRAFLFGVTSFSRPSELLYPVMLALHVNPDTIEEKLNKGKSTVMTYGGFVEFVWADELTTLSCSASTGAFLSPEGGLAAAVDSPTGNSSGRFSSGRRKSMAWERQEDLVELFRSNGHAFNSVGQPILRAKVSCLYDRGLYLGVFRSFEQQESADNPFVFQLSWEFVVESCIYKIPGYIGSSGSISSAFGGGNSSGGIS